MGWSGTSLRIRVKDEGSGEDAVASLQEQIWEGLVYQYWRSRCYAHHHLAFLESGYRWDGVKPFDIEETPIDGEPGYTFGWLFYDHGPQTLMMHWLDIALCAREDKIESKARLAGFELVTRQPKMREAMNLTRCVFVDTGAEIIKADTDPDRHNGEIMVFRDLARRYDWVPLSSYPAAVRKRVHRAVERRRCGCPLCENLHRTLPPEEEP